MAPCLVQIRTRYSAEWKSLSFSVESGPGEWTLRVEETATNRILHSARRGAATSAQVAAAEYGIFRVLGPASRVSPEALSAQLNWRKYL